ncbi:unnamed protein product [Bemisia tabaci]|uniref:E3 ubiquitin-protein ligase CHFR n=1 Tax=Bemisia tabaci TaxID=7038 RepID=A0A9P0AJ77_BEMTA|nr:unnamed protein product [Bemisia tabaci]
MNLCKRSSDQSSNGTEEDPRPYLINQRYGTDNDILKQKKYYVTGDEFSVGRSQDATLSIPDTFVSRNHCIVKKKLKENSESSWFLHHLAGDRSSTWINGIRLKPEEVIELNTNDLIEFSDKRNFSFRFHAPDIELERKRAKRALEEEQEKEKEALTIAAKLMANELEQERMKKEKEELELKMQERIQMLEAQYQKEKEELEEKIKTDNLERKKLAEERALLEEKLAQEKLLAEQKFKDEKLELEDKLKGLEETVKKIEDEKLRKEEERKQLEEEAERIKATLAEKETALKETAEQLKKDGEYEENIKKMTEELDKVKSDLIQNLDKQSLLEKQLKDTAGSSYLIAKTELLESFGEVVESELQCSICNELYIEAMVLQCMHTFCAYCLNKWKKRKKECPVCRAKIKTENRAFIWDSFIDKMVSKLSEDLQQRRKQLIAERAGNGSTSQTASVTPASSSVILPHVITTNGGTYQVANINTLSRLNTSMPRAPTAQTIRVAVPVTSTGMIASAHPSLARGPNVRGPFISGVRLLGSIDLTQNRPNILPRTPSTPRAASSSSASRSSTDRNNAVLAAARAALAGRSTPVASSRSSSSSTHSLSPSRSSARLRAKRRRVPTESSNPDEVVDIEEPTTSEPIVIEDAVIEIPDESTTPASTNATSVSSDSDDDNVIVVPVRRLNRSNPTDSPQPSTSSSEPPASNSRTSKRKRDTTIVLSSDSGRNSSDSNSDTDSSSVEGHFDYEYNGGRCWDCGRRGHWARACPENRLY